MRLSVQLHPTAHNGPKSSGNMPITDIKCLIFILFLFLMLAILEIRLRDMKFVGPLTSVIAG